MRLVGATRWYTQLPFLIEAVVTGVVGAVIAVVGLIVGEVPVHRRQLLSGIAANGVVPPDRGRRRRCWVVADPGDDRRRDRGGHRLRDAAAVRPAVTGLSTVRTLGWPGEGAGRKVIASEPQGAARLHDPGHLRGRHRADRHRGQEPAAGRASLVDAFATVDDGEVWLRGLHIPEYTQGSWTNHEPRRTRKLLLHRGEIERLIGKTREGGLTLVPLSLYFSDGKVKVRARAGPRQAQLRQAPGPGQARRRPRDRGPSGGPAKGRAEGVCAERRTRRTTEDVPRWLAGLGLPGSSTSTCISCRSR